MITQQQFSVTIMSDTNTLKTRMKTMWMAGNYGRFARYLEPGALQILEGWHIAYGSRMLDVGCGAGQIAIPAARAGIEVTGVDIAANWLEQARIRAALEGVNAQFDEGDAEQLPYPDGRFDVVVSLIGAMFAPNPERVAAEMLRVCRPGGRIIMVNWTAIGFVADMFKTIAKYVPPPVGVPPAVLWGDEAVVRERLRQGVSDLRLKRGLYPSFNYPFPVPQVVEFFRQNYGPTQRAFAALNENGQRSLRNDLERLFSAYNRAQNGTTSLESRYLEVMAVRA